jgi:hypothetical protein
MRKNFVDIFRKFRKLPGPLGSIITLLGLLDARSSVVSTTVALTQAERRQILSVLRELKQQGETFGRSHRRRPVAQFMWLKRLPNPTNPRGAAFKIRSEDVSLKGIGFFTKRRIYRNEYVVIPLQFREGGGQLVLCRICFCRQLPSGGYRAGAEFEEMLPDPKCKERIPSAWLKLGWATSIVA